MTFFSILLFASAFYFANARPDSQASVATVAAAETPAPPSDDGSSVQANDAPQDESVNPYQEQLDGFQQALDDALTKYIMPIIAQMTNDTQTDYKSMSTNGCYSYLNYVMFLAQSSNPNSNITRNDGGIPIDRGDIIVEFDELNQLDSNTAALPATDDSDDPEIMTRAEATAGDSDAYAEASS